MRSFLPRYISILKPASNVWYVGQGFFYYVFFLQSVIAKDSDKQKIDAYQVSTTGMDFFYFGQPIPTFLDLELYSHGW